MLATIGHNSGPSRCIFRAHGERGYTKLRNAFLQDRRISDETRGLVARLLSLPDDWEVTVQSIIASGKAGRDKVYRMIKEAEEFGYIQPQNRERLDDGKLGRQIYHVSDDPEALIKIAAEEIYALETGAQPHTEKPDTENPDVVEVVSGQQILPCPENPDVAKADVGKTDAEPCTAKPDMANRTQTKEYEVKININNNPPIVPPGDELLSETTPDRYSYDFEEFWKVYPRREGKGNAFRAWKKIKASEKRKVLAVIGEHLPGLIAKAKHPDGNFCPMPSTWINQKRYDDDPPAVNSRGPDGRPPPRSEAEEWHKKQEAALAYLRREEPVNG